MYRGKHVKRRNTKPGVLLASLVLLIALTVGTTVAFLIDDTNAVENTFQPAQVSCAIQETFDGNEKTDVKVKNTSNIDAFIRAEIIVNWVKAETGNIVPAVPAGYSYTLSLNTVDWTENGGYYYYSGKVAPDAVTKNLITSVLPVYPEGVNIANALYQLQVTILAEAIQADGLNATTAQEAWANAEVQP